jgi:hypothetical protein
LNLIVVPPNFVDMAWADGANCLAEACETSGGEITGDQLKLILSRGERTLVRLDDEGKPVGWGCFRVDQLPNVRVLHITDLVAHNARFQRFFDELTRIAKSMGCSEVRCCCKPAQAKLFQRTNNFEPVYTTLRVKL